MALDFSRRSTEPELMDADDISYADFEACLRDLARVNVLTLAYRPTLAWFARLAGRADPARPLRVLDVGSGYGDMLRALARWAGRRNVPVELVGLDRNPWARQAAEAATPAGAPIRYETGDLFAYRPERPFDAVISSLFAHHLSDPELVRFLRWMDGVAVRGWFVNDLRRHRLPYRFARLVFPALRLDPMVIHDGPVSISRALTRSEWLARLDEAGLRRPDVRVESFFPYRFGVGRLT
jgi:SAM-dependent methyltransferase